MCVGLLRYLFVLHPNTRTVAHGGFKGFQPPTNFETQVKIEKICYKCIPLCSCVCFELSFKASESLTLLVPPCGALLHLVKIS